MSGTINPNGGGIGDIFKRALSTAREAMQPQQPGAPAEPTARASAQGDVNLIGNASNRLAAGAGIEPGMDRLMGDLGVRPAPAKPKLTKLNSAEIDGLWKEAGGNPGRFTLLVAERSGATLSPAQKVELANLANAVSEMRQGA
jgi:hypothetical protein